ncbi:hypothetical protein R1flu_023824 [Riccia fluitans]|uniref:Uncharacterized protein n=1 Tax=Riccia fluitans TaxID=41844 RepID=A0ABD1XT97_9MARC
MKWSRNFNSGGASCQYMLVQPHGETSRIMRIWSSIRESWLNGSCQYTRKIVPGRKSSYMLIQTTDLHYPRSNEGQLKASFL